MNIEFRGEQVRAARAVLGWTQHDLADKAGVSRVTIANVERGFCEPKLSTIRLISRAFERAGITITAAGVERKDKDLAAA